MKRTVCAWVLIGGMLAAGAAAQTSPSSATTTLVEPPTPLLATDQRMVVDDAAAGAPSDDGVVSVILAEDGLKRTETRAVKAGAETDGWIRAYQFGDATGAFSAYSYFRQNGKRRSLGSGKAAAVELPSGEIVFLSGVSVVRAHIRQSAETVSSLLTGVETGLPKVGGRRGLAPLLPTLLPKPGIDEPSLRYALGPVAYRETGGVLPADILAWNKSAEVATARYSGRTGSGTLTLLLYPTPQIAGDQGRAIEQAVKSSGAALASARLRRIGPLVGMTSGGFTESQASALLGSLHLNTEVNFDKAPPLEFHAEVRKTATLLQSIAVFTGVGILAALLLGVFLGGARAGIRVLQGKPAASEPEFLRIDLHGRSAPFIEQEATAPSPGKRS